MGSHKRPFCPGPDCLVMNVATHHYQHQSFDKRRAGPFLCDREHVLLHQDRRLLDTPSMYLYAGYIFLKDVLGHMLLVFEPT
jgi:hypothetical protein